MNKANKDSPRIGQITYSSNNYGSLLQCYATQKIFEEISYECEFIEVDLDVINASRILNSIKYRFRRVIKYIKYSSYREEFKELDSEYSSKGGSSLSVISREKMAKFKENYICIHKIPINLLKKIGHSNEYTIFISGSDQIWSASNYNINDNFFLRFAAKDKRVAFAPSFGSERMPIYNQDKFKKYISEYNLISCREKSGSEIIFNLTGRKADVVCDPVFQLSREYWEGFADKSKLSIKEKYIFAFFIDQPSQLAKETIMNAQDELGYNLKMLAYKYEMSNISYDFIDGDAIDFLKLIKNAELVITDSFHVTAFSLILHTNFLTVERNYTHSFNQSVRITNLLDDCGYSSRYINSKQQITDESFKKLDFVSSDMAIKEMKINADVFISKIKSKFQ